MQILLILSNSPFEDQGLDFARHVASQVNGTITLLTVSAVAADPHSTDWQASQITNGSEHMPDQDTEPLILTRTRYGELVGEATKEIAENQYQLAVIGATPSSGEEILPPPETALARVCAIPLAIVHRCPGRGRPWQSALVCSARQDSSAPSVQAGLAFCSQVGLEPTILHVVPAAPDSLDNAERHQVGSLVTRKGQVLEEIEKEYTSGQYCLVVIGGHSAPPQVRESGPTLVHPDMTRQIIQLDLPLTVVMSTAEPPAPFAHQPTTALRRAELGRLVRSITLDIIVYAVLVVIYALISFRLLAALLQRLFESDLATYAGVGLLLILGQGILLEEITSFLLDRLRLERFE